MFSFLTGSERQMKLYHFSREDHAIIKKIVQGIEQIRWFSWKCCSTSLLSYKTKVLFHYLTRSNSALVASATNCLFFKKSGCVDNGCRTITHCWNQRFWTFLKIFFPSNNLEITLNLGRFLFIYYSILSKKKKGKKKRKQFRKVEKVEKESSGLKPVTSAIIVLTIMGSICILSHSETPFLH